MTTRCFSDEELGFYALSGSERMRRALATGDATHATAEFAHVTGLYRQFVDVYHGWTASIFHFMTTTYGHEFTRTHSALEHTLARSAATGASLEAIRRFHEEPGQRFSTLCAAGEFDAAFAWYTEVEQGARDLHDLYRDYVSDLLSQVYRAHGADALEACLRASSALDWMPWMQLEVDSDPAARLVVWAELLGVGNFGTLRITEHDDRFEFIQDPCGSCGRQQREGRCAPPWNLAVIEGPHAVCHGQAAGMTTAYRAHIAVMHWWMPLEQTGVPWPLIECPRTPGGRCRVTLFKEARRPLDPDRVPWSG